MIIAPALNNEGLSFVPAAKLNTPKIKEVYTPQNLFLVFISSASCIDAK